MCMCSAPSLSIIQYYHRTPPLYDSTEGICLIRGDMPQQRGYASPEGIWLTSVYLVGGGASKFPAMSSLCGVALKDDTHALLPPVHLSLVPVRVAPGTP